MKTERDISFHEAWSLTADKIFIDVRTPREYEEGTIPGAVNVPIFNNAEREDIGTIYNQQSPAAARLRALEIVAPKLPALIRKIEEVRDSRLPVLFCWRGGMRSKSISYILELMKFPHYRLRGGYKEFRQYVLDYLQNYSLLCPLVVLHGYTGVGKTDIIRYLQDMGLPALDLEGLAGHRGSAFGAIGLGEQPGQKVFDALLWLELEKNRDADCLIIEAESKRIGKVVIPDFLISKREEGINIMVEAPLEKRVKNLVKEYQNQQDKEEFKCACEEALKRIRKRLVRRIGKEGFRRALDAIREGNWDYVTGFLLENYYDPLYEHSQKQYGDFDLVVRAEDTRKAAEEIAGFLRNISS